MNLVVTASTTSYRNSLEVCSLLWPKDQTFTEWATAKWIARG
jgi:hypothetical protein